MAAPPLHERLVFDTARGQVMDADRRYLLMRADVFMGMFDLMPQPSRAEALSALARSVSTFGGASVRAYAGPSDPGSRKLFASVAEGASSLGWGNWHFDIRERSCELTVVNSPFAAGTRQQGMACAAIAGMLKAVCEHAWGAECIAQEVVCCAASPAGEGSPASCRFRAFLP